MWSEKRFRDQQLAPDGLDSHNYACTQAENIYLEVSAQVVFIIFECVSSVFPEPPLGISFVGVSQIFDRRKDWNWGSAMLISKILGVSTDTPDTLLTGLLFSITL